MNWKLRLAATIVACLGGQSGGSAASELAPISDIDIKSKDDMLYLMKRCSAVSLSIYNRGGANKSDLQAYYAMYDRYSDVAFNLVNLIAQEAGRNASSGELSAILSDIELIYKKYNSRMEENYISSGKIVDVFIIEDVKTCVFWYDNLIKNGT